VADQRQNAVLRFLLRDLLKQVSRSFYLTLAVLPDRMRTQLGLAYLFARAADTIADTDLIARQERLALLAQLRAQFASDDVDDAAVRSIQAAVAPCQALSSERTLLNRLGDCFRLYGDLNSHDRARIRQVLGTLTQGMEMDLTVFRGDSAADLAALESLDDLDRYTYYVAGCVGVFWTEMMCAHVRSLAHWDVEAMAKRGVRFGKGLQLTNVLKDVARDLQRGRCYIPVRLLEEVGLEPYDLLKQSNGVALRPVLQKLIGVALDHLDQGWLYMIAIPRREIRLRLACMWPLLFAGETLRRLAASADLLNPAVDVKISRGQVYRILVLTTLTGGCGYVATAYWGRLRKQII
jgi:farnesyl-diphosphate farnesyltransferase